MTRFTGFLRLLAMLPLALAASEAHAQTPGSADPASMYAIGTPGKPCAVDQALACADHASKRTLRCSWGKWEPSATCADTERCALAAKGDAAGFELRAWR